MDHCVCFVSTLQAKGGAGGKGGKKGAGDVPETLERVWPPILVPTNARLNTGRLLRAAAEPLLDLVAALKNGAQLNTGTWAHTHTHTHTHTRYMHAWLGRNHYGRKQGNAPLHTAVALAHHSPAFVSLRTGVLPMPKPGSGEPGSVSSSSDRPATQQSKGYESSHFSYGSDLQVRCAFAPTPVCPLIPSVGSHADASRVVKLIEMDQICRFVGMHDTSCAHEDELRPSNVFTLTPSTCETFSSLHRGVHVLVSLQVDLWFASSSLDMEWVNKYMLMTLTALHTMQRHHAVMALGKTCTHTHTHTHTHTKCTQQRSSKHKLSAA